MKNFVFDLYGTLIDIVTDEYDPWFRRQAEEEFFSLCGGKCDFWGEYFRMCAEKSDDRYYEPDLLKIFIRLAARCGCKLDRRRAEQFACRFRELSRKRFGLYPEVLSILSELKARGAKLYLLSNAQACFTRKELKETGLDGYFDGILLSSDAGVKKPSELIFNKLIYDYKLKKSETVYVGNDFYSDVLGAQSAGLYSVYIRTYSEAPIDVVRNVAGFVAEDYHTLKNKLISLAEEKETRKKRKFGILIPVSALPSDEGIGTLGRCAYDFVDYLRSCRARVWQVLPLNPTNYGDSPYQSCSANALNYYFIDLATLCAEGLLKPEEVDANKLCGENSRRVDYGRQFYYKLKLLKLAYSRFEKTEEFKAFEDSGEYYDFAVFMSLKERFGHKSFTEWDEPYRTYDEKVIEKYVFEHADEVGFWQFTQFVFLKQWNKLKDYAHSKNIEILGDIPLYIAYDSAEMWKYGKEMFKVDENRKPSFVAGCPPDAFTDDGQLWGNPLYDWEKMKSSGYVWWHRRINDCFKLYDILRIDHFRGFDSYYAVPADEPTARNGHWEDGPKEELFEGHLSQKIIAEDLGLIDDGVRRLLKNVGYAGMKILLFAFDGNSENEHKPSNYTENYVCYTGTHDNMPLRAYVEQLTEKEFKVYLSDLDCECRIAGIRARLKNIDDICRTVMRLAFVSRADTLIIPLWDILGMGEEARINFPSTVSPNNWSWRFREDDFNKNSVVFLSNNVVRGDR